MTVRKITIEGDEVLHQVARDIKPSEFGSEELRRLASDMAETMVKSKGVGIAAPQVGESIRLFIIDTGDGPAALANPFVSPLTKRTSVDVEGCLSCPGQEIAVARYERISVQANTIDGEAVSFNADGFLARVIQHEFDHLNGILITDKK